MRIPRRLPALAALALVTSGCGGSSSPAGSTAGSSADPSGSITVFAAASLTGAAIVVIVGSIMKRRLVAQFAAARASRMSLAAIEQQTQAPRPRVGNANLEDGGP